jgi:L-cysteine:1D-myo-inositol 2-amino-2-deoxy-alpha-D-glucopyranoside ligase
VPLVHDTATDSLVETQRDATLGIYVCGITPYDATHIGHAATYLAHDTLIRLWLDAGHEVRYVQNATDVDDPLLERATALGVAWQDLAASQLDLFRSDMQSLGVIPPDHYVAVTEMIGPVAEAVDRLRNVGIAYAVDEDLYFDIAAAAAASSWQLGQESRLDRGTMLDLARRRGGDPDRAGKRDPLDPLLWRAARDGEPSWDTVLGAGRPGWHIECSVIAQELLELPMAINGGGADLIFPHHEFTAAHTAALTGGRHAHAWTHAGLVSFRGTTMSKSLGNLVLVSALVADGVDPRAIRLAILGQHYRVDWEWTDALLASAQARLEAWLGWSAISGRRHGTLTGELRDLLSRDLDTPAAIAAIDARVAAQQPPGGGDLDAIAALLGIRLRPLD